MQQTQFKAYKYRWVVLLAYMFIVAVNQLLWITFAAITSDSSHYYGVSDLQIGMLSMCFMLVFIVVSIPASWMIDTYGIRVGVGIGAVLTGIFGLLRGMVGTSYDLLLLAQIGIAVGQPFLINAITKLAARWFPVNERATASGLGTLAMYLGVLIGLLLTPYLEKVMGMNQMLYVYGLVALVSAILFILLVKEHPRTPVAATNIDEKALVLNGMKELFRNKNFYYLLLIFFVGLGVFNCVTTWIEDILKPRGFSSDQAGLIGGIMIIGGILGALVMPMLSDYYKKRKPFIVLSLFGAIIGLAGITFATTYGMLLTSGAILGFFLLSAGPIGFQYAAEITHPISEVTSNGLVLLAGQISGIAFIFGLDSFKSPFTGAMTNPLIFLIILSVFVLALSTRLKESPVFDSKK
jgi:cyanate permease